MLNDIQWLKKENIPDLSSVVFCMQVKPFVTLGVTCSSMWTFGEPAEVWTSWRIITQQAMWQAERSDAGAIWYWTKKDFVTLYMLCFFRLILFSTMTELVVQRITKLMVQIILPILSHRSDNFSDQQKTNKQTKVCFLLFTSGGQSTQIKYLSKSTDMYNKILLQ